NQIVDLGITMFEKFKKPFGEALDSVMQSLEKLSNSLANGALGESVDKIAVSFGKLIEKLSESVTNWLPKIIDALAWIMDNASFIASGIAGIGTALMVLNVANMIMGLVEAFKAFKAANEGATVAQWLLNAAMAANPIGLVVSIIAGLIAGIIVLWNTNEDFRNAVIDAWNAILGAAQAVWGAIVDFFTVDIPAAWQSLLDFFNGVPGWFADLWTTIQQAFVDGWNAIVNFFTQTI
ncbi:phage tail tape measure protein, partial [Clostridium botulinum]|nr:phage tail tape measure protein [Clostridium botulinum]